MANAWHLKSRPQGMPTHDNFELKEIALAPLDPGMVHVRNQWLSVDPYMRGRMNDTKSYVAPYEVGAPLDGGAVGTVVASNDPGFSEGDLVFSRATGWRDEGVVPADMLQKLPDLGVPPQAFLGNLGLPGATAWFGLFDAASAKERDTVFVSAAAGAVGSAVVQLAKARGMTVIGSAGGADKCDYVRSLGADAAIDYKAGDIVAALGEAAPDGIDVYFDNVGGEHLDAAYAHARERARFAICGMITAYNSTDPQCFSYIMRTIAARIRVQGFLFPDYMDRMGEFYAVVGPMVANGELKLAETVKEGLQSMPDAFLGLFSGANTGKMLVRL